MSTRSAMMCMLVLIPVGASSQGRTMTGEEFFDASSRGLNLPEALQERFFRLRVVPGSRGGWCVEYRQVASWRCRAVAVYVDGVRIADPAHLFASQPVKDIARAELLSAVDAFTRYGSAAGWGALLIETRTGRQPAQPPPDDGTKKDAEMPRGVGGP